MTEQTKLPLRFESPSLPAATASIKPRISRQKEDGQSQADAKSWKHTMNYKAMNGVQVSCPIYGSSVKTSDMTSTTPYRKISLGEPPMPCRWLTKAATMQSMKGMNIIQLSSLARDLLPILQH